MKKEIIIIIISFILGFLLAVFSFYNEDWNGVRPHLEWERDLGGWNIDGDGSLRQCLYYFSSTSKNSAILNSAKQPGAPEGKIAPRLPQFGPLPKLFGRE